MLTAIQHYSVYSVQSYKYKRPSYWFIQVSMLIHVSKIFWPCQNLFFPLKSKCYNFNLKRKSLQQYVFLHDSHTWSFVPYFSITVHFYYFGFLCCLASSFVRNQTYWWKTFMLIDHLTFWINQKSKSSCCQGYHLEFFKSVV